jgi:hypothetical protein
MLTQGLLVGRSWKKSRLSYMKKLLFGSGVRPSVKRFDFGMTLQVLSSDAALLEKFPNLTQLNLHVRPENVESFRNLMRRLPKSCPKLGSLQINDFNPLEDVDFLGGNDGELPPIATIIRQAMMNGALARPRLSNNLQYSHYYVSF